MTTKYGARNQIQATVGAIKTGDVMSQVKLEAIGTVELSSVMTTDSLKDLDLKPGDKVSVIVKAIHVLVVKE
ncbi:MAG: TOBE domain-containing protein [Deltaproteobacteria bacterium]|nr:TOBE domain-containing protein [Deltaproteobacteria bacterium]